MEHCLAVGERKDTPERSPVGDQRRATTIREHQPQPGTKSRQVRNMMSSWFRLR